MSELSPPAGSAGPSVVAVAPAAAAAPTESRRMPLLLAFLGLLIAFEYLYGRLLPNLHGRMGHDFSYVLPDLLAGDYWFHANGPFAVPWFTPAFCGGRPYFADPQSTYYSVAQWLSFVVDPVRAVQISLLLFAGLGFVGMYRLARDVFAAGRPAAFLAGAVFMFNGFYGYRMVVGHFTFHSFMLVPALAWLFAGASPAGGKRWTANDLRRVAGASLVVGYMANAGLGSLLIPTMLATLLLVLWALRCGRVALDRRLLLRVVLGTGGGLAIAGAHVAASLAMLSQFPRSDYSLPGFASLFDTLSFTLRELFLAPADIAESSAEHLLNVQWLLGRHEFEYGVGIVPLLAIVAGVVLAHRAASQGAAATAKAAADPAATPPLLPGRGLCRLTGIAMVLILALPVLFNTYQEDWTALVKSLPLIGASSTLIRWYMLYVPLLALVCIHPFARLPRAQVMRAAVVGTLLVVALPFASDKRFYELQPYTAEHILGAWQALDARQITPPVANIGVPVSQMGAAQPNDALAEGVSILACYYPTFGYALEHFPRRDLRPGPVDSVLAGDHFNLKNPACYVFPQQNQCAPGDHFRRDQKDLARRFVSYQEWPFAVSSGQQFADALSLATLVSALLAVLAPPLLVRVRGNRTPGSAPAPRARNPG